MLRLLRGERRIPFDEQNDTFPAARYEALDSV